MLNTKSNFPSPDDYYEALLSAHHGLSVDESHAMNARLVLLLSNHIGDMAVIREALQSARGHHEVPEAVAPEDRLVQ